MDIHMSWVVGRSYTVWLWWWRHCLEINIYDYCQAGQLYLSYWQ